MADGTGALDRGAGKGSGQAMEAEPPCPAAIGFGVPGFLAPRSLGEVKELARMIVLAEWAPDCYRDIDGNYLQPKIELAILHGATVGLGPIAAVHAIAVIGGTPSIWGDGALSVIEHSGLLEDMVEDYEVDDEEGLTAICTMKRRDRPTPIVTRFSMAMAERAGLTRSEGPWQTYPERMLRMRARSWTMRDAFADVLRGLQLREEVEDYRHPRQSLPRSGVQQNSLNGSHSYRSPRPKLVAATPAATVSVAPPPSIGEVGETRADQPKPEATLENMAHTLIDADGVVLEIAGAEALRTGFEQMFFDKHLSPDQALGVWESNEPARGAIERLFGKAALRPAEDHLASIREHRRPKEAAQPETAAHPHGEVVDGSTGHEPGSNSPLLLNIDPTWGIQKVFHHYRAALTALCDKPQRTKDEIAQFRHANLNLEKRLRATLPSRAELLEAIYRKSGLEGRSDVACGTTRGQGTRTAPQT
jgi:hypothetical protein